MKITGTIDNWVAKWHKDLDQYIICGDLYEDTRNRWPDGSWFYSSAINIDHYPPTQLREGMVVETLNSSYRLGPPRHD